MVSEIASAGQHDDMSAPPPSGPVARVRRAFGDILRAETDRTLAQRTAVVAFVIRASSAAMALLSQVLLARWLGSHEYGVYAFVFVVLVLSGALIPMGFSTTGQRFIAEYSERRQ